MKNNIFDNESKAVEWLANHGFFSVLEEKMNVHLYNLANIRLSKILNEEDIKKSRAYVRAFEIDYIAVFREELVNESQQKSYMGIEVKYFYKTNLENRKYHQGIGQFIEYLKWGFDYVTLVHIFDRNIEEDINMLKNKIDEFKDPACELFKLLQAPPYHLPLAYVYLIVESKDKNPKSYLQNDSLCWFPSVSTQLNPFMDKDETKIIRNCLENYVTENLK